MDVRTQPAPMLGRNRFLVRSAAGRIGTTPSELRVKTPRKDRYGPAVGVVCRIGNELIVKGERRPFVEAVGVIGFDDFLSPVVELPVANQDAEPSGGKISARFRRQTFDDAGNADLVV